ncbi:MAG TPA: hypothetical protein VG053_12375 [Solirubrobacteraceae bacterium]|nr:hypothetical protein [Solirubrobacteraceae bacterium]
MNRSFVGALAPALAASTKTTATVITRVEPSVVCRKLVVFIARSSSS